MRKIPAALSLGMLVACGGGGSPPTAPATQVPTPTPVTYSGTYTGTAMTWTDHQGQLIVTAFTTITRTPSGLSFTAMQVSSPVRGPGSYLMGPATLTNDTFDGTNRYSSAGCGGITNHYRGSFGSDGNTMNITMTKTTSGCGQVEIRGEMRRF